MVMADLRVSTPESLVPTRARDMPEVPENIWADVSSPPGWRQGGNFNEENVFHSMYDEAVRHYMSVAMDNDVRGETFYQLFQKYKPIVANFTRTVLRNSSIDDPLDAVLNWDPEGNGEAEIRPFYTDSFAAQSASYEQTPTATGQFNIVPDDNTGDDTAVTATANEQGWVILGYADFRDPEVPPYDRIQEDVNDNVGTRRPIPVKQQVESVDSLPVIERRRGPLMVMPGNTLDVDVHVEIPDLQTGLWPLGFEIIRADAGENTDGANANNPLE